MVKKGDLLVNEVTTAPQHAAIMRWRCLLLPSFFLLPFLPPAAAAPADEDSGMFEEDEELVEAMDGDALELAAISAGILSVAMLVNIACVCGRN